MAKLPLDKMAAQLEDIANDITGDYERRKVYPWDRIAEATATIAEAVGAEVPDKKYSTKKAQVADVINAIADADIGGGGSGGDFAGLVDGTITKAYDSTVTSIRDGAFSGCRLLSEIDFPNVEEIGVGAFYGMYSGDADLRVPITSAAFPKCKTIGYNAFYECYQLSYISFPECTTIDGYAFSGCPISEAIFPKCTSLQNTAFGYSWPDNKLEKAIFPKLQMLGAGTFADFISLEYTNFSACESIYSGALKNCTRLSQLVFPSCKFIHQMAFTSCTSLASLYLLASSMVSLSIRSSTEPIFSGTLLSTTGHIYVPASLLENYKNSDYSNPWQYFSSNFVGMTDEEIEAFYAEYYADEQG